MTQEPAGQSWFPGYPTSVVLYRTPGGWRFAVTTEKRAIIDGHLRDLAVDCDPDVAQRELSRMLEDANGTRLSVTWREADKPDWWIGAIEARAV